ncbi:hypothetical protein [Pistricoccus aurantiacus]|uniref:hypothetical protein n=1 Tax=Pistricoccus aurantiacus TaxID=1883414 RepID=UPI003639D129
MITCKKELERIKKECASMVTKRASLSAGAAVVPIPGVDVGSDIALLVEMIPAINKKFGLTPEQIEQMDAETKIMVMGVISNIGSQMAGKTITKQLVMNILKKMGIRVASKNVVKYIPLIGQVISGTISFGGMKYIGNSHINDCYKIVGQLIEKNEEQKDEGEAFAVG